MDNPEDGLIRPSWLVYCWGLVRGLDLYLEHFTPILTSQTLNMAANAFFEILFSDG